MNELKYKGLTVEERIMVYFELARDATLFSTSAEMLSAAMALIHLLEDADIDRKETARHLRQHAQRCGIFTTSVITTIDNLERG